MPILVGLPRLRRLHLKEGVMWEVNCAFHYLSDLNRSHFFFLFPVNFLFDFFFFFNLFLASVVYWFGGIVKRQKKVIVALICTWDFIF